MASSVSSLNRFGLLLKSGSYLRTVPGKFELELSPEGITHTSNVGKQQFFWELVNKPVLLDNHLFVIVGDAAGLALDRAEFSSEQIQSVIDYIHSHKDFSK